MSEPHGYTRDGETVVLRMTRVDFHAMMLMLSYATIAGGSGYSGLALMNRLNAGRPAAEWSPYEIPATVIEDSP